MANDKQGEVIDAILEAKNVFEAAIRDSYAAGFPLGRLIGICGYANCRYVLGDEAVEPWRIERGYPPKPKLASAHPSPLMMSRR
jgi:hypothetical protein